MLLLLLLVVVVKMIFSFFLFVIVIISISHPEVHLSMSKLTCSHLARRWPFITLSLMGIHDNLYSALPFLWRVP